MAWRKLCGLDEVAPGAMHRTEVEGTPVLVVRGELGFVVIPPSCPHMENPLADGVFDGCVLTCTKHLWQWTIPDGLPTGEAEEALLTYESEAREGAIWVNYEGPLSYDHEDA